MVRTGRPKDYTKKKNRRRTVLLTEKAMYIIREVLKSRPNFNFSRYVSEHICKDFEDPVSWEREKIIENQKKIDALYAENNKRVERVRQYEFQ